MAHSGKNIVVEIKINVFKPQWSESTLKQELGLIERPNYLNFACFQ